MSLIQFLYFIWLIIIIYCSVKSKHKFGMWTNHYAITNFFWAFSLYISLFHNYYVKPVSAEIYLIFFFGQLVFNFTLFTSRILPYNNCISGVCSLKKRRIVELLVLIVIVPLAYNNLKLILAGEPLWKLYDQYWENTKEGNYTFELFRQAIIIPLSTILMSTCFFINYFDKKKYSKYLTIFIGASLSILSFMMSAGGRKGFMQFIYIVILSWMAGYYLRKNKIVFRIKMSYLVCLVCLAFGGILYASQGRGDENMLIDVLCERFSLYPALFEGWYKLTDVFNDYTLGYSMFEMPIVILTYPFKMLLGLDFLPERVSVLEQKSQFAPALGAGSNACVSAYFYYMRDFGILGIVIGPYIVGKIYNFLWKICRKDAFLLLFYISGVCLTCTETDYPFCRGYVFVIIFAFIYRKYVSVKYRIPRINKIIN